MQGQLQDTFNAVRDSLQVCVKRRKLEHGEIDIDVENEGRKLAKQNSDSSGCEWAQMGQPRIAETIDSSDSESSTSGSEEAANYQK